MAKATRLKYLNVRGIALDRKFIDASEELYKEQGLEIAFYATTRKKTLLTVNCLFHVHIPALVILNILSI